MADGKLYVVKGLYFFKFTLPHAADMKLIGYGGWSDFKFLIPGPPALPQ